MLSNHPANLVVHNTPRAIHVYYHTKYTNIYLLYYNGLVC